MLFWNGILMNITVICMSVLAFAVPPNIDLQVFGLKDPASLVPAEFYKGNKATMNYRDFSSALTRAELANRITYLPVADEMRQTLVECAVEKYPSYLTAHDEIATRNAKQYFDLSCVLIEQRKITGKQPSVEKFKEQIQVSQEIERNLISAEHEFIISLQDCLNLNYAFINSAVLNSQNNSATSILESLSLHADYRYSEKDSSITQRGIDIDLRAMVNLIDLDLRVRQNLEVDLIDYDRSMAALKPQQYKAFWEVAPRMQSLIERSDAGDIDSDTFTNQSSKVTEAAPGFGVRIRNEALATALKITNKLPADKQKSFNLEIHKVVFPEFELDAQGDSLRAEFTAALVRTDLPKDIADRVANLQQSWCLELDVWQTKADATVLEWSDGRARGNQSYGQKFFKPMLAELLNKRAQLHDKWRVILIDQLPVILK